MVGGMVIAIQEQQDRIYINCREMNVGQRRPDECAIYVERNADSEQIRPGDNLWWQGNRAMWTPHDRRVVDEQIPRRSYSGVAPPATAVRSGEGETNA